MEEDLESEGDSEVILRNSNPPKEAPPSLPCDLQNTEEFGPSETDDETGKPQPRTWWTKRGPPPPRRGPPPPVPPRASSGQAKLLSFKKMKISDDSQSDVRALLGKHTGHLEEILTRQNFLLFSV